MRTTGGIDGRGKAPRFEPTREEIIVACAEIRAGWCPATELSRRGMRLYKPVFLTGCRIGEPQQPGRPGGRFIRSTVAVPYIPDSD